MLESYAVEFETLEPVIGLLRDLGRSLLEETWATFVSLGEVKIVAGTPTPEPSKSDTPEESPSSAPPKTEFKFELLN